MFYLVLSILCSALISILMRLSESRVTGKVLMLCVNYLVCTVLAALYTDFGVFSSGVEGLGRSVVMGVIGGVLFLASFLLLQFNVEKNGVVMSSVFMKLGLLVPLTLSVCCFGERLRPVQIVGFLLALAGIVLINMEKERAAVKLRAALILLLLLGGASDSISKIHEELGDPALGDQFLFFIFAVALVLSVALALYRRERMGAGELLFGLLVGVPNYFSSRFLLLSLRELPAVIAYPTFSVGTIVVVTAAGLLLFRERLGKWQWAAMAAIPMALVLLNL